MAEGRFESSLLSAMFSVSRKAEMNCHEKHKPAGTTQFPPRRATSGASRRQRKTTTDFADGTDKKRRVFHP
jgi:hypothetical protein